MYVCMSVCLPPCMYLVLPALYIFINSLVSTTYRCDQFCFTGNSIKAIVKLDQKEVAHTAWKIPSSNAWEQAFKIDLDRVRRTHKSLFVRQYLRLVSHFLLTFAFHFLLTFAFHFLFTFSSLESLKSHFFIMGRAHSVGWCTFDSAHFWTLNFIRLLCQSSHKDKFIYK